MLNYVFISTQALLRWKVLITLEYIESIFTEILKSNLTLLYKFVENDVLYIMLRRYPKTKQINGYKKKNENNKYKNKILK